MADENFWMNPRSLMGAKWHGGAGLLGERLHTMETLPATPAGTTDEFINGRWVPRDGFQYDIEVDGNTESFNFDNRLTPGGMEAFRRRQGITANPSMVPNQFDPATGGGQLRQYLGHEEETPQKVIPAQQTKKWPWGQSIANMFRGAINQIIPPAY
jgi:hypothetical protein